VQTKESANKIVESNNIGISSGVVLTVSPIVAQNIQSSIANSGLVLIKLSINSFENFNIVVSLVAFKE